MSIMYKWRDNFDNIEIDRLHGEAFEAKGSDGRDWQAALTEHGLGWVTARDGGLLIGFVNVVWDGTVHAWIQDVMVARDARLQGIGTRLVAVARGQAKGAGCQWLHVDFDDSLADFYYGACGFSPTSAGLIRLE